MMFALMTPKLICLPVKKTPVFVLSTMEVCSLVATFTMATHGCSLLIAIVTLVLFTLS